MKRQLYQLVMFLAFAVLAPSSARAGKPVMSVGKHAPDLAWTSVEGDTLTWGALAGERPLVLVFWATWCAVCKKEWPRLAALKDAYADSPVPPSWANVSVGESPDKVARVAAEWQLPGRVLVDPHEVRARELGIDYVPTVAVLDGALTVRFFGSPDIPKLDRLLRELTRPESGKGEEAP